MGTGGRLSARARIFPVFERNRTRGLGVEEAMEVCGGWRAPARVRFRLSRGVAFGFAAGLLIPPLLVASFLVATAALAAPGPPAAAATAAATEPQRPARAVAAATVRTDLATALARLRVPDDILVQAGRVFAHAVDLQREVGPGDSFRLGYETLGDENRLLFLWLRRGERTLAVYRHTTKDGFTGYFDGEGRSVGSSLLRSPVQTIRVSSDYGMRRHPILGYSRMHRGIDFAAPDGAPVLAAGDGFIEALGTNGGYGRYVRIRHPRGRATAYAHLGAYAEGIGVGDAVRQGQVIGYVGASGLATGPHLHFEVLEGGVRVDPGSVTRTPWRVLAGAALSDFRVARIKMLVVLNRAMTEAESGDRQTAAAE